jgi:tetratricopeptide (TPR) repeat protein
VSHAKPVLTKEELGKRLKNLSFDAKQTQISDEHWLYRERTSVRAEYSLDELEPSEGRATPEEQEAIKKLIKDSTVTYRSDNRPVWRLKHDVRYKTLKRLSAQGRLLETLESNQSKYSSHLQNMLDKYIRGFALPLEKQNLNQLEATLQVVDWLKGCLPNMPVKEQIRHFIAHKRLLKPFHFLVGKHFIGREIELNRLREYVGVLSTNEEGVNSRTNANFNNVPPLLIYGPGGIGKSTLIAKFILEHAELEGKQRIPYVYIDFNRRDIDIQEPASILLEAYRQLGIQYPFAEKRFSKLEKELRSSIEEYGFEGSTSISIQPDINQEAYVSASKRRWSKFNRDFAETVSNVLKIELPLLIVLDTIEEMLYHNIEYLDELWTFIKYLKDAVPTLRIIFSGRSTLPKKYLTQNILLNGIDSVDAVELLIKKGIPDKSFALKIIEVVGHSPFSLWLAADLYHRMESDFKVFEEIEERHEYFYQVKEYFIQGQLYKRILGHIHDPRIKSLAHPGMILRRITPDLILNVLAVPCKIEVKDLNDAKYLFDKLRKEISLVEINQENPNEIRQRSELRLAMLELLLQDEPSTAKMIHQLAATYFRKKIGHQSPPNLHDRVDEIYHRLALGEEPAFLDNYNPNDLQVISEELGSSIQDLPVKAQTYLVSRTKIDIQLDDSIWDEADLESWEHMTFRTVQNLLNLGRYEEALKKLESRENRSTGSPLYQLHVHALIGINKIDAAMKTLEDGICHTPPNSREAQNLLQIAASIFEEKGQMPKALDNHDRALKIAQRIGDDLAILRIQLKIVRLMRTHFQFDAPELQQGYKYLLEAWEAISDEKMIQNPALIRDVTTQIGHESPEILKRAVSLVGFGSEKPTNLSTFASAMASWDDLISSEQKKQSGILAHSVNAEWRGDLYNTWRTYLEKTPWDIISRELTHLINNHTLTPTINITLVELIKAKLLLTTQQSTLLEAVLQDSFKQDELRNLIEGQLGISIAEVSRAKSIDKQTADIVSWVESNGKTLRLLQALIDERPNNPQIISLLKELNLDYQSIPVFTNAEEAIKYYNQVLKRSIRKEEREEEANAYDGLANAYAKQTKGDKGNNIKRAISYLKKALMIRQEVLGEHHPDTAKNLQKIGLLFQDMGNLNEAKLCYEEALSIDLEILGANHPNVSRDYNNLGSVYSELGDYGKAIEFYEQALEIDSEIFGNNHPNVTIYYSNLGSTYSSLGDSEKAIEYYEKALAIDSEVYGVNHPNVAVSLNNLGIAYSDLGDFKNAIEFYERALAIDKEIYGDNHPNVARDYNNLGIAYSDLGQFVKSIEFYEKALAIDSKVYGDNHPNVAVSLSNLGSTYSSLGDSEKAIEFYERALSIDLKVYGDNHPNVARDYNNLGIAYSDLGQFVKSIEFYEKALAIDSKVYGDNHPNVAVSLSNLGNVYVGLGEI